MFLVKNNLIEGLKKLEYRGYDSVGIALVNNNKAIDILKSEGKIDDFLSKYKNNKSDGQIGIGHTRWATHGIPSDNKQPALPTLPKKLNKPEDDKVNLPKLPIKNQWKYIKLNDIQWK